MTPRIRFLRFFTAASAFAVLLVSAVGGVTTQSASADTYVPISGSGSTWSSNALDQWRKDFASNFGVTVNYSASGSSAGRTDFINGSVDFAVSEIPFQTAPVDGSAPENATDYAYMPIVAGGTSFMYNLNIGGKRVTDLQLDGTTITKIFTGAITNWNDPAIQATNPSLAMPNKPIVPVVRSDGSGSTAQFTLWMAKQHSDVWCPFVNEAPGDSCGLTSQYPNASFAKFQSGSLGVAGYVSQGYGEGAITYVEYSYALNSKFPVAKVLNAAGNYAEPTASAVAIALGKAKINADLTQDLSDVYVNPDPAAYPLSSYSYMIIPTVAKGIFTNDKGKTLAAFVTYVLCNGQQQAAALGYSPLPANLVSAASEQVKRIPGGPAAGIDCSKVKGGSTGVTVTPDPTASAAATTAGAGGAASTGAGADGSTAAGTTDSAAAAAASNTAVYDANGAIVSGSSGVGAAVAASKPLVLDDSAFGSQQIVMIVAGLLLVLAIVLPPFLSRRLKRSK
ncbi:phosphate ABC transporter substrate-binding protein PstS [Subtercola sp. PAMC28395]|uniref:phosphate ABC transporter substrate-binding protein PstS n=1 Tax=Subtercola sp. PAMC28395 TaxID=2846775 RepID=UPI00209B0039|nr:phosphate ABC transporter substrate-binding protein PstS [Subtercola sp. PAMC28395]